MIFRDGKVVVEEEEEPETPEETDAKLTQTSWFATGIVLFVLLMALAVIFLPRLNDYLPETKPKEQPRPLVVLVGEVTNWRGQPLRVGQFAPIPKGQRFADIALGDVSTVRLDPDQVRQLIQIIIDAASSVRDKQERYTGSVGPVAVTASWSEHSSYVSLHLDFGNESRGHFMFNPVDALRLNDLLIGTQADVIWTTDDSQLRR